jgi:electron transfer flavoprotein alpha subunit
MIDRNIVVIGEHFQGELKRVTYDVAACARELEGLCQAKARAVLLGDDVAGPAYELVRSTGLDVIAVHVPGLFSYNREAYASVLEDLLHEMKPSYVCAAASTEGLDLAPALAIRLGASCLTGVERVFELDGEICFARGMCGGKIVAHVRARTEAAVVTVQPGCFRMDVSEDTAPGAVDIRRVRFEPRKSRSLGVRIGQVEDSGLREADIIVSAGRGIGKKENLDLIYRLAALFPKSAVGGTRPVCDLGWLEYKNQVGLTGATVTPELYVACGISGAQQHLSGMRGSQFIVAVNTDPHAAIFNVADVCVVEDLNAFIPALIQEWEQG